MEMTRPTRRQPDSAGRAFALELSGTDEAAVIDEAAVGLATRLIGVGVPHEAAWAAADAMHRATSAVLICRLGRAAASFNRLSLRAATLEVLPSLISRLLPNGNRVGSAYVAPDPRGNGKITVDMNDGTWSNRCTGAGGSDPVSLVSYLEGIPEREAAKGLLRMLRKLMAEERR